MSKLKFVATADVSNVIKASKDVQKAQDAMERGFEEMGDAAVRANAETQAAIKQSAATFELAERRMDSVRVRGSTSRAAAGARVYGVSPLAAQPMPAAGVAAFGGASVYKFARSEQEQFQRWAQAQQLRQFRQGAQTFAAQQHLSEFAGRMAERRADVQSRWDRSRARAAEVAAAGFAGQRLAHISTRSRTERMDREAAVSRLELSRDRDLEVFQARMATELDRRARRNRMTDRAAMGVGVFAGAALATLPRDYLDMLDQAGDRTAGLHRDITPLVGTGRNVYNVDEVRRQVLAMSGNYAQTPGAVAGALYDVEGGASNLDKSVRGAIVPSAMGLTELTGSDLGENAKLLTKVMQIYGDELGTVATAQNKLFSTADLGAIEFGQMATLMSDVLPSAKAMGNSFDEVAAAIITATQVGGRSEKVFTGLRNIFLRMPEAAKEGVVLTGNFAERLQQLSKVDPNVLKKIFDIEAMSLISAMAEKSGDVRQNLEAIAALPPSIVESRLAKRLTDPGMLTTMIVDGARQSAANAEAIQAADPAMAPSIRDNELSKVGAAVQQGKYQKELFGGLIGGTQRWLSMAIADLTGGRDPYRSTGLAQKIGEAQLAGDANKEIAYTFANAKDLGLGYRVPVKKWASAGTGGAPTQVTETEFRPYGETEGQFYLNDRSMGFDWTAGEALQHLKLLQSDPGRAQAYRYSQASESIKALRAQGYDVDEFSYEKFKQMEQLDDGGANRYLGGLAYTPAARRAARNKAGGSKLSGAFTDLGVAAANSAKMAGREAMGLLFANNPDGAPDATAFFDRMTAAAEALREGAAALVEHVRKNPGAVAKRQSHD